MTTHSPARQQQQQQGMFCLIISRAAGRWSSSCSRVVKTKLVEVVVHVVVFLQSDLSYSLILFSCPGIIVFEILSSSSVWNDHILFYEIVKTALMEAVVHGVVFLQSDFSYSLILFSCPSIIVFEILSSSSVWNDHILFYEIFTVELEN